MLLEGILANDKPDAHGEEMSPESLVGMVADIQTRWIPVGAEHDPRVPPQGRVLHACLRKEPDGSTSVVGQIELFDPGETPPFVSSGRRLLGHDSKDGSIAFHVDRGFGTADILPLAEEIAEILGAPLHREIKKSLEPIAVAGLAIGTYVLAEIAGGFLKKVGADVYDAAKAKLKKLFEARRSRNPDSDSLFSVRLEVKSPHGPVEVEVLVENPTGEDVNAALSAGLTGLVGALSVPGRLTPQIAKIVFIYRSGRLSLRFAIRHDAVPLFPSDGEGGESMPTSYGIERATCEISVQGDGEVDKPRS